MGKVDDLVKRQLVRRTRTVLPFVIGSQDFLLCLFARLAHGQNVFTTVNERHIKRIDQGLQNAIVIVNGSRQDEMCST